MPGLSFVGNRKKISLEDKAFIIRSFGSMLYAENYKSKFYITEPHYLLGATAYDGYPVRFFKNDEFLFFYEGELFGLDESTIQLSLCDLASSIFNKWNKAQDYINDWVKRLDGDFLIFIASKTLNSIIILNDMLGRLPTYFYITDDNIIISRDLFFISEIARIKKLDRMAIAQYMLFGYPLGERTLLESISRLKPASLIKINFNSFDLEILNYRDHRFNNNHDQEKSISQNAKELASLFSQACRRRHKDGKLNILGLSGGLDSRSVAACLSFNNIQFTGVTRLTGGRASKLEAQFAREVSKTLKFDWNLIHTSPPKGQDVLKLLMIKNGSNNLAMSFMVPFFERIRKTYGVEVTYWTGDGGDKFIPDLRPSKRLANLSGLVSYVINEGIFSLEKTVSLTRLEKAEIIGEIESRIASYPERELSQKYIHFLIFERAFKFLFEGEDRNRCYYWSVTPFYSREFVDFAANITPEQKSKYKLYEKFLEELSNETADIGDPDHKLPKFSKKHILNSLRKRIISMAPIQIKKKVKRYQWRSRENKYREIITDQINECSAIDEYLSTDLVRRLLSDLSIIEMQTLLTISSVIEIMENGRSSIKNYKDIEII